MLGSIHVQQPMGRVLRVQLQLLQFLKVSARRKRNACKILEGKTEGGMRHSNMILFVYLGRSVGGGRHMLVHEQLMDRSRPIQKYKSG